jgi:hypothetical protein
LARQKVQRRRGDGDGQYKALVSGLAVYVRVKRVEEGICSMLPLRVRWPDSALATTPSRKVGIVKAGVERRRVASNGERRSRSKKGRAKRNGEESDRGEEREPSG